jgi:hypothetical protein
MRGGPVPRGTFDSSPVRSAGKWYRRHVSPGRDDRNARGPVSHPISEARTSHFDRPLRDASVFRKRDPALRTGLLSNVPSSFAPPSLHYGAAFSLRARRSSKSEGGLRATADKPGRTHRVTNHTGCGFAATAKGAKTDFKQKLAKETKVRISPAQRSVFRNPRSAFSAICYLLLRILQVRVGTTHENNFQRSSDDPTSLAGAVWAFARYRG